MKHKFKSFLKLKQRKKADEPLLVIPLYKIITGLEVFGLKDTLFLTPNKADVTFEDMVFTSMADIGDICVYSELGCEPHVTIIAKDEFIRQALRDKGGSVPVVLEFTLLNQKTGAVILDWQRVEGIVK